MQVHHKEYTPEKLPSRSQLDEIELKKKDQEIIRYIITSVITFTFSLFIGVKYLMTPNRALLGLALLFKENNDSVSFYLDY